MHKVYTLIRVQIMNQSKGFFFYFGEENAAKKVYKFLYFLPRPSKTMFPNKVKINSSRK